MCQKEKLCEHHQARQIYIQYSTNSEDEIAMLDASSEKTTRIVAIYNFFSRLNTVWKCHYLYTLTQPSQFFRWYSSFSTSNEHPDSSQFLLVKE